MKEDYAANKPMYMELLNNEGEVNIWTEMVRGLLGGRARHSFASLLQVAIEKIHDELRFLKDQKNVLEGKTDEKPLSYNPKWRQLKMKIQRLLGEDGILLFPSHPTFAPFHRESYLKPMNFVYTAIFNALGFPVTQVPLGLDSDTGLPLGIQVVGGMYMDRLTIAVAKDLEKAFGGWKCPAKIL
ncbi:Protein SCAF11 [Armadillidium vulgare]|nr:Protein SCAF11 [Armadillidium vulgare]